MTSTPSSAHAAIIAAYRGFENAFFKGDVGVIEKIYTEDAQWIVPQAPVIKGKLAIRDAWKQVVGEGGVRVRIETFEVQEVGEWAFETGRFVASTPDDKVVNAGKYLVVWKRTMNNEWKIHRDIFNWEIPPSA